MSWIILVIYAQVGQAQSTWGHISELLIINDLNSLWAAPLSALFWIKYWSWTFEISICDSGVIYPSNPSKKIAKYINPVQIIKICSALIQSTIIFITVLLDLLLCGIVYNDNVFVWYINNDYHQTYWILRDYKIVRKSDWCINSCILKDEVGETVKHSEKTGQFSLYDGSIFVVKTAKIDMQK